MGLEEAGARHKARGNGLNGQTGSIGEPVNRIPKELLMGLLRRKRYLDVLVVVLAACFGVLLGKQYIGADFGFKESAVASVAEARICPEKEPLPSTRRMLGAQVLVFRERDYEQVEKSIIDLKDAGVNTLIVRAFHNRGDRAYAFARPRYEEGVYFETSHALVVDPVLTNIVSIGHRHGLKVFAWMETRKMPLNLPYPNASRALRYRFDTGTFEPIRMWSIFDETVEKRLIGLFQDVVWSGIDGILFQDDLVMYQYEDFSPKAATLFEEETGRPLDPQALYGDVFQTATGRWLVSSYSDTFWMWSRWKNQRLLDFAHKLMRAARAVNPEIKVAMNFMYEAVTDPQNALAWLSQSLAEATRLPIDYYAIMAYHRQIRKELHLSEAAAYDTISDMTATLLNLIDDGNKVLMKVQMADWDTRRQIPSFEADEIFRRINNQGRVSLAFVPYTSKVPLEIIGRHFQ
jgi:hypothetical protein